VRQEFFHDSFGGKATKEDVASTVLLIGDPLLVGPLAERVLTKETKFEHYEFHARTGIAHGKWITLMSTGVGGGSASIGIDNLAELGAETLIYLGSISDRQDGIEIHVAAGAARLDGASLDYAPMEYPAAADPELLVNLLHEARDAGYSAAVSILVGSPGPLSQEIEIALKEYEAGLSASRYPCPLSEADPEVATLLTLGTLYGLRVGVLYRRVNTDWNDLDGWAELAEIAIRASELPEFV